MGFNTDVGCNKCAFVTEGVVREVTSRVSNALLNIAGDGEEIEKKVDFDAVVNLWRLRFCITNWMPSQCGNKEQEQIFAKSLSDKVVEELKDLYENYYWATPIRLEYIPATCTFYLQIYLASPKIYTDKIGNLKINEVVLIKDAYVDRCLDAQGYDTYLTLVQSNGIYAYIKHKGKYLGKDIISAIRGKHGIVARCVGYTQTGDSKIYYCVVD